MTLTHCLTPGLPGGVSSIFVSRLSTALHAASAKMTTAVASMTDLKEDKHHPKPRLVLTTLVVVSLPIEMVFLGCVVAFGWIHLPFLFMVLKILFFLIAVRIIAALALEDYH